MKLTALLVSCLLCLPALTWAADPPARPNVILIVIDDLGWADLGCYGSRYHRSPNLDKLAAGGLRLTQAYSACPVCSPSRTAVMTGKWPARLHLTDWLPGRGDLPAQRLARPKIHQELPLEEVTLGELFQQAGYATASIGKWHLGGPGFGPEQQGFALNVAGDRGGSPPGYLAPFERKNAKGKAAGRQLVGLESAPEGSYLTDLLNDAAVSYIEQHRSEPFFIYLPHYGVHIPLQAPEDLVAKYGPATPFRGQQNSPVYAAMIENLDAGIGRILAKLDELKLADNTLVLFTSDNGGVATLEGAHTPATSNAPLREGKGFLYEGGIRVPLIARWPARIKAGTTSDVVVCGVDLLPTLAEVCSLKVEHKVDGVSIAPLLFGSGELQREALYWHYPHYANQGGKPGGVVRAGDWKLIEFYENDRRELYNLKADPRESKNLAAQEPQRVQELAERLAAWRKEVGAQSMTPNAAYLPNPQADNGTITMHSRTADVYGEQLRFEPLTHKNTLGYWTSASDWAQFEFTVKTPGQFDVELVVGCGNGSGGSEVEVIIGESKLAFTVEETGGFQEFKPRTIGRVTIAAAGRHTLQVRPRSKPGPAVMDLREVRLVPVP